MDIVVRNKTFFSLFTKGKVLPFQLGIYAKSGHGKGLASEFIVEEWRKLTKGVVLIIADPKNEAEYSYVQYPPTEKYHCDRLRLDGIEKGSYPCKMYHPFTFNIPKGYLPNINFYSISLKDLTREELSILSETPFDSESIKLMLRVSNMLLRNEGLFKFLHRIQDSIGNKKTKKRVVNSENFYLNVGAGKSKSLTEISGYLYPFKKNYFLRKDICQYKLNWKEILEDNSCYHVFLSMFLDDDKIKEFAVLNLLNQVIRNRNYCKKPILIVIPEIKFLCPRNPMGYKYFLSVSIANALSTMRSMGRGISSIIDSQTWEGVDDKIKSVVTESLFGGLSLFDLEKVCKARQYPKATRDKLVSLDKNEYVVLGKENEGIFRIFFPSHKHGEPKYNWIETYKRIFPDEMQRYDELKKFMKKEIDEEDEEIKELINKRIIEEKRKEELKKLEKENKTKNKSDVLKNKITKDKEVIIKMCYEMFHDESLDKRERSLRAIGRKLNISPVTAKSYEKKYAMKLLKEQQEKEINTDDKRSV